MAINSVMQCLKAKFSVVLLLIITLGITAASIYGLLKPVSNGCTMTYMYPTYIPISTPTNVSFAKYGLYLYHEGWQKIDFADHIKQLSGTPVLFIPGNGGSYKQVRSLAAESERAYQGGPLENELYQQATLTLEEDGGYINVNNISVPTQYSSYMDWFAVDLEGEHSAMDGQILEEHTEYVVYAIHRILDQYKESRDARKSEGAAIYGSLPQSVILVGHSMGGFVARAAIVHPHLRKSAVGTLLTLSTPHQSPPVTLQPSLGRYYTHVNQEWKKGYEVYTSRSGQYISGPKLEHIIVVSVSGGINDFQVRSKLESLDGIVPPSNGFMISTTSMQNVWLSMEHQVILWCNQVVVQVAHTLLHLIDSKTSQPFMDSKERLAIFTKMLHSGVPESWLKQSQSSQKSIHASSKNEILTGSHVHTLPACPSNIRWNEAGLERDLYIQTATVTVLAMDGRRRWLDINKLGLNGKGHFVFVTNLVPCSGVRLHLWPEKGSSASDMPLTKRVLEVTSKMIKIPSGPAPRQVEPGSQTEQAPPSSVFKLDPKDMHGFKFLTISVAPPPVFSGRPPPATSMAVGQFFDPDEGKTEFSPYLLLQSMVSQRDKILKEDHPLALDLSFSVSLGLLPVKFSLEPTGCGIQKSELVEEVKDMEISKLCKRRCFPPVALAWDVSSGLHIFPNLYSQTIMVDSSPGLWNSPKGSEKTTLLLLVDPHCSYKTSISVSVTAAAGRFLLLYWSQIIGFSFAVVFFALMQQAYSWELDLPIPSMLKALESNMKMPLPFFSLVITPIAASLFYSFLSSQRFPSVISIFIISILCYAFANGIVVMLILISQWVFYMAASIHVFIRKWWQWETNVLSYKVVRIVNFNPSLVTVFAAMSLACFVHPAFGLAILLLTHALCCHSALSSFLTASFRSHARSKELFDFGDRGSNEFENLLIKSDGKTNKSWPVDEHSSSSPDSARSYGDTQLEIFHHQHGLLVLHLMSMLMFVPSLVAWFQRVGTGQRFPWFLDSALTIGIILHGVCGSKPEYSFWFPLPGSDRWEVKQSFGYLLGGFTCCLYALTMAPYGAFYAMACTGIVAFTFRIIDRRNRERGEAYYSNRKHSHRH
ncbi:uncharacterized protein LOC141713714 isoform X1 [Apium graveolens]|uniref:uncharacterized protein LOC141713714 isoform X1 n=2 Tax=Apium graveolens TaxID=4045 RepID=UPI003D7B7072